MEYDSVFVVKNGESPLAIDIPDWGLCPLNYCVLPKQAARNCCTLNKVLVTGAAGFIGYHLSNALMDEGYQIIGLDNINDYYDVTLKEERLARSLSE